MKREELINDILTRLYQEKLLNVGNYSNPSQCLEDAFSEIEGVLDNYIIVRGDVLE